MDRYYNLDVLADVLAKASCMSGVKPVIGRNQCQLGMNGIKKVVSAWAIPDQTRHLKSSSCRGVCMCEEEMCVRTICTKGVSRCAVGIMCHQSQNLQSWSAKSSSSCITAYCMLGPVEGSVDEVF